MILTPWQKNPTLLTVEVQVDSRTVTALVNTGLAFITSTDVCKLWEKGLVCITTIAEETSTCCGIRVIQLQSDNSVKFDVLVTQEKSVSFNLLIGMNVIKEQGRIGITSSATVEFCNSTPSLCATIISEELDFSAKFDKKTRV